MVITGWPLMTTIGGDTWTASGRVPCKSSVDKVNGYTFRGCNSTIFSFASLLNEGQLKKDYDMSHSMYFRCMGTPPSFFCHIFKWRQFS